MVFAETPAHRPVDALPRDNAPLAASIDTQSVHPTAAPHPLLHLRSLDSALRLPTVHIAGDVSLATQVANLQLSFRDHTGCSLVFAQKDLSQGNYYDALPSLPLERQVRAAEIAVREAQKYPPGFLEKLGLKTFGIFEACVSYTNDGYHAYDARYGGYRWYGIYNFEHGAAGAYYSDAQLPLTIHHEIFHAVDAHYLGKKGMLHYESDNGAFSSATLGERRYPALSLSPKILADLKKASKGVVLQDSVSDYTKKSADEDQAETARHLMMNLADSLIQAAERPELPGSQRILHILGQYRTCVENGPDTSWFTALALGKPQTSSTPPQPAAEKAVVQQPLAVARPLSEDPAAIVTSLFQTITNEKRAFIVRGSAVDDFSPNPTLQEDIRAFATQAQSLIAIQERTKGRYNAEGDLKELLGILEAYEGFISLNYKVSKETQRVFRDTRGEILKLLPERPRRELLPRLFNTHYLGKVDRAIHTAFSHKPNVKEISQNLRAVQPAVVMVNRASGFNINPEGTILTNAHVTKELHKVVPVQFPNGQIFEGVCTHIDTDADLALVKLKDVQKPLPFVRFSREEAPIGSEIILIGQPDTYDHWHVSTGKILNYHPHPHTAVDGYPLGGIEHDGWTFWGNSGSPILNLAGLVVGAHNTYDDKRNMRCGVRYQPTIEFLKRAKATFEFGR